MRKHGSARRMAVRRKPLKASMGRGAKAKASAAPANQVYKFASTKEALKALPDDVRCVLLLGGHIVNELTTLNRLLVFTSKSWQDPIENTYAGIQYLTLIRLTIGKVAEGPGVFQNAFSARSLVGPMFRSG